MTGTRRLFFPGYYSGFSNNKMSLDIAIALAHLTGRTLAPYRFRMPRRYPVDPESAGVREPAVVPDLFEIPVPWSDAYLFKTWLSVPTAIQCTWAPVYESVFAEAATDDHRFRDFRNGRQHVYSFTPAEEDAEDLLVSTQALGLYSHFFWLDDQRRAEITNLMQRVRPKQPYRDLAARLVAQLGSFNAIHLRRADFVANELSRRKITRAASISGQEIVANLASRMARDDPLVICTDGSSREELFGPIQDHFREVIFLDRYLRQDPDTRALVSRLPRYDEAVDALLAQLVASQAQVFAGTLFSTFTALIHRLRAFEKQESRFLFCYSDFLSPLVHFQECEFLPVDDGPFSWNRFRYPVSPDAYSWLREWPEAANCAPPPFASAFLGGECVELAAGRATLHGTNLRCLQADGGQTVVGDWIEANEFLTWDLLLSEGGRFAVQIRYACPEESAGSAYRLGTRASDELQATVWNTGAWESLSPWLPLGRLHLPAGQAQIRLRAETKAGHAVMNVSGVRLTRV